MMTILRVPDKGVIAGSRAIPRPSLRTPRSGVKFATNLCRTRPDESPPHSSGGFVRTDSPRSLANAGPCGGQSPGSGQAPQSLELPAKYRTQTRKLWRGEEGITYIIAFVFMVVMVMLVFAYLDMASAETREIKGRIEVGKAFWFAEAGLHKGIWRLTAPPPQGSGSCFTTPGVTETLDEGSYTYRIQRTGNVITVTSRGKFSGLPNYEYTVEQRFNRFGPPCR